MNDLRNEVLKLMNSLFEEIGKNLPLIPEPDSGWASTQEVLRMRDEGEFN
jgi:hypothetical protein